MSSIQIPLLFAPVLQEKVWGGNRLGKLFGKACPTGGKIGESWEISDRPEAQSHVDGGPFDGWSMHKLMEQCGAALLGRARHAKHAARFPLLVKYVDAGDDLSVQVHPDDAGARALGIPDRGKTECWVVVHVDEGARVQRGLRDGVTRAQFEAALAAGRVEDVLHYFTPQVGDLIAIPPGMIHAICKGVVVAEIQQNSDITFRVFDYNRPGLDGKPRQLHVAESMQTIRFDGHYGTFFAGDMSVDTVAEPKMADGPATRRRGLRGQYFDIDLVTLPAGQVLTVPHHADAPMVLMILQGAGSLDGRPIAAGQSWLLPADLHAIEFRAEGGPLTWLESTPTIDA